MVEKTYIETLNEIEEMKKRAENIRMNELGPTIDRFKKAISVYGILPSDVFSSEDLAKEFSKLQPQNFRKSKSHNGARPPKFTNPSGDTWSGYGRRPQWFIDATASGQSPESMLISSDKSAATHIKPASSLELQSSVMKPVSEKDIKGAQQMEARREKRKEKAAASPASGGAKTGKGYSLGDRSWTGVGPRPRWLKDAIASGKTLEQLRA